MVILYFARERAVSADSWLTTVEVRNDCVSKLPDD